MSKIDTLYISFTDRNARRRGPTSSAAINDMHDELASDLAGLYDQWNNRLRPLSSTLPDGTIDSNIDAFTNGLDGQTLYTKSDATVSDTDYYNNSYVRPNTVYEQFQDIYTNLETLESSLSNQISGQVFSAANISIVDNNNVFDATEVESALSELYTLFSNSFIIRGTGSPEGVITAGVGSVYVDSSGGIGSTLYIKESGTGNTGWNAK